MPLADQIRRAVETSPRADLPNLSHTMWKAYAAGGVTEEEASELTTLIEARKGIPASTRPATRRVGARPRTSASMTRRRQWAASGRLPPRIAARFTLAEQAVLSVLTVAVEAGNGACVYPIGKTAALAGVGRSTVKNALREAHRLGFIRIEERRSSAWRNAPNRVTITSPEWQSWMRLRRPKGGGVKSATPTNTKVFQEKRSGARFEPRRGVEGREDEDPERGSHHGRARR